MFVSGKSGPRWTQGDVLLSVGETVRTLAFPLAYLVEELTWRVVWCATFSTCCPSRYLPC